MQYITNGTRYIRYSPSDLINYLDSEFASWMDRRRLELAHQDDVCQPDERDEQLVLLGEMGLEHEAAFLDQLRQGEHSIVEFNRETADIDNTENAMREGNDFIFQAQLGQGQLAGIADFLARKPGQSEFGDYHYEAWDTKLSHSPKASFIIQLCAYTEMLEEIQHCRPNAFEVVLGTNEQVRFLTKNFIYYFQSLKRSFLEFHDRCDPTELPDPRLYASYGRWSEYANQILEASDHLSRVANITRSQIKKLEAAGIDTLSELAVSGAERVPNLPQPMLQRLQKQAELQLRSKEGSSPQFAVRPPGADNPRRGLALLPPPSDMDIYFDIEGYPLCDGGLEYLWGAAHLDAGEPTFVDWWAHDAAQEKVAFERFVDWAHSRWIADPSMHIYHYAAYEVSAIKNLMGKHATREREVDSLLRKHVFIDLYTIVRQGLVVGTTGYSLKDIEQLYLPERAGEVTTAGGSVVAYHRWMLSGEGQAWEESPILGQIRDYNKDDCVSTLKLTLWLRDVQSTEGIGYVGPDDEHEADEEPANIHPATILADQLTERVNSENCDDDEDRRITELLARLLEFHWREAKPVFWRMFNRHEKTEPELIDDFDCLGGLERTATPPEPIARSLLYEYQYDPDQDTKLHEGSKCFFANDLSVRTTVVQLDTQQGLVQIKLGPRVPEGPAQVSLIPDEYVRANVIADAVLRYVDAWSNGNVISRAIDDLVHRRSPRIDGHQAGPIIPPGANQLEELIDVVRRMDDTVLCIQGPPGTGKTYTAARAICALLQDGKKVAVTANSHKVILNLLRAVHNAAIEDGLQVSIVKVGGDSDDPLIESGDIQHLPKSNQTAGTLSGGAVVVGGTAWVFSRPELQGTFDYLIVDEAGQFSIANVIATGLSANNVVLVGDQMQLAQPLQGHHPGESGMSALEYLLEGRATIPPELGVFLEKTWRMHPAICGFISEAVYEGRLQSHANTASQRVHIPDDHDGLITRDVGIVYIPVPHEGNTQASEEEAEAIKTMVDQLIGTPVSRSAGEQDAILTMADILVVAPFNMQVRLLQERLGSQARVGSVDKFQGQEADVVIISMCSSTLEESPRGADFLLDPNRINVAVSRARALTVVVASPSLLRARCQTIKEMELVNLFCWLVDYAERS